MLKILIGLEPCLIPAEQTLGLAEEHGTHCKSEPVGVMMPHWTRWTMRWCPGVVVRVMRGG